ncbi:MAG: tRNA (N(6)-L-threonylcarbamoyladenosine(37)-C(2))-methylthiotransferase MtaB [Chloroflexi bacterium RBG_16_72_14]|nr:MAG: tRNA (N(6)-L-threonylcarbamoyladenosine(37)-C(2))-methylthiotransferase MtaB [Chloroflexi bacterium RBG_16_72_14]
MVMPRPAATRPDGATARPRSAAIVNLGCKVNQSEMEAAARLLREACVPLVDPDRAADLYLVNTCTVTSIADEKSRAAVRRARRANPDAEIVVTGCSVQVGAEMFAAMDPAARLVTNEAKAGLLRELEALVRLGAPEGRPHGPLDAALPTLSGVEAAGAAGIDGIADDRASVERTRAFVKVQDGCSFYCTYCIIPRARGAERSLEPDVVLADVRRALAAGHREIVLTGINIGTYDGGWSERGARGSHVRSALTLAGLVRRILEATSVERIRLSSIEPQHVDDELLEAWVAGAPRTLPHLHLPLQSGDDGVLRRMGRRYAAGDYARTVERARAAIPGVAVHADVIAGFPTEDDTAFARTMAFVREQRLAGLHVFRYSARPGTPATRMAGQVDERTKKARAGELLAVGADARAAWARAGLRTVTRVLVESRLADGRWVGHAEDHVLVAVTPRPGDPAELENAILTVRRAAIDGESADRVTGEVLAVDPAPRSLRVPLPVLAGSPAPIGGAHVG